MSWIFDADQMMLINFDKILFLETDQKEILLKAHLSLDEDDYITIYEGVEPGDAKEWFEEYRKKLNGYKI